MTLIAKVPFRYASRQLVAGESFEPESEKDAEVLRAIGKAADASPVQPKAIEPKATEPEDDDGPLKTTGRVRRYRRMDMRADEE